MKISQQLRVADAKEMSRQGERAFTMIEIALAIGVIGFALVAIIGILPIGMTTQKDNREDTVISQDAPFFLDAIRNGTPVNNGTITGTYASQGLDFLTNYVQSIQFNYYSNGNINFTTNYYNTNLTGLEILGLLSTPQVNYNTPGFASNYFDVTATVRALSGPATAQQGPPSASSFMAFTYKMEVMVTPFNSFAPSTTNYLAANLDTNQSNICFYRWVAATTNAQFNGATIPGSGALTYNLFDMRLRFSWPVLQNGTVGPGRQTYRTLVASALAPALMPNNVQGYFFQPQSFTNTPPQGL